MKPILIHKSHVPIVHEQAIAGLQIMCEKCNLCSCLPSGQNKLMEPCIKANEDIINGAESLLKDSTFEPIKKEVDMPTVYILYAITNDFAFFKQVDDYSESIKMNRARWKTLGRPETLIAEFKNGEK